MFGYIYKTTNKINNKIYVGQKQSSEFLGMDYLGSGFILSKAIKKYGKENFSVELIDTAESKDELNEKEIYWISKFDSRNPDIGYNITFGGSGGDTFTNNPNKENIRIKLSNISKNRVCINKNSEIKYVKSDAELQSFLADGWQLGKGIMSDEIKQHIKQSLSNRISITNGFLNKRIKPENLINYPGFHKGYTYIPTERQLNAIKNRGVKATNKKQIELQEWLSQKHFCKTCGILLVEKYGSGVYCSKKCACSHKHSEETKQLLADLNKSGKCGKKGLKSSDTTKEKQSKAIKNFYNTHSCVWITKDGIDKRIDVVHLDEYLKLGYSLGRNSIKGKSPWNKGLTKETDVRVANNIANSLETKMERYGTLNMYEVKNIKEGSCAELERSL